MMRYLLFIPAILIAACTNITPVDQQYSGFLDDYSGLEPLELSDGSTAMRWHAPDARAGNYTKVIVNPVEYYPRPQPSDQVSRDRLLELSSYMTALVKEDLGQDFEVVSEPGPNTFSLRFAITGVETPTEGLKVYNAIPVSMVIAGISTAIGERDHVPVIYIEAQATDSVSGKMLAKGVRQGVGENLKDDQEQLSLDHLKEMAAGWSGDVATMARRMKPAS